MLSNILQILMVYCTRCRILTPLWSQSLVSTAMNKSSMNFRLISPTPKKTKWTSNMLASWTGPFISALWLKQLTKRRSLRMTLHRMKKSLRHKKSSWSKANFAWKISKSLMSRKLPLTGITWKLSSTQCRKISANRSNMISSECRQCTRNMKSYYSMKLPIEWRWQPNKLHLNDFRIF